MANNDNDSSRNIDSNVYKWNGTNFVEYQTIPTNAAIDWEFFTISSENFLAVTNYYNESSHNIDSKIYRFQSISSPILNINYDTGAPGSYFTINGSNFPSNEVATISVNGTILGTIPISANGDMTFLISTTIADEGSYFLTASVNPMATVMFTLDSDQPIHPQDGSGPIFEVPSGIAYTRFVYLPIIVR